MAKIEEIKKMWHQERGRKMPWAAMESLKRRVASLEARANGGEP